MSNASDLPEVSPESRKNTPATAPAEFLELLAPVASSAGSCIIEVQSVRGGKLRMKKRTQPVKELFGYLLTSRFRQLLASSVE